MMKESGNMELDLQKIRQEIDRIDREIVKCFEERMNIVLKVAEYKKINKMQIIDQEREKQVIAKNIDLLSNKNYTKALGIVLEKLMAVSRGLQQNLLEESPVGDNFILSDGYKESNMLIGYQGVPGSFSQQALQNHFSGHQIKENYYLTFEEVFKAVESKEINYGVLPIENSTTGAVNEIYDLLNNYDVCIVGEQSLKIEQCLLAKAGTRLEDVKQVYSHPQGFQQSKDFLADYPHWEHIAYFNTAKSAQHVAESSNEHLAAIAGKQVMDIYSLEILAENINLNIKNHTRFIVISNKQEVFPDSNKISLIISLPHKSGSLARVLNYFEEENINLLKLESRPDQNKNWTYYFYIDFEGSLQDKSVQKALGKVNADSVYFKILGNYPAHKE